MNSEAETVENFYGVYLLYCQNPKYLGRTYIGYTVNPNRRIKQHNKGKEAGGAWKTSKKGPWVMLLIVHGFPNDIAALRFEWSWQHPQKSRRLNHLTKKKAKEKVLQYNLRILSEMLSVGPWNRLPLTVRWLAPDFAEEYSVNVTPPIHMPICYGAVKSVKVSRNQLRNSDDLQLCSICYKAIESRKLTCLKSDCTMISHPICLSKFFTSSGNYVPIEGYCPNCNSSFLWGDIIRKANGCYKDLDVDINPIIGDQFYDSD